MQALSRPPRQPVIADYVISHRIVDETADLIDICHDDRNVVTLRRPLPAQLASITSLDLSGLALPLTIRTVPGESLRSAVSARCADLWGAVSDDFADDVTYWAQVFADVTECTALGIRVVATTEAMCPRFHVDRVVLRGVMTYLGPGTQYVANHEVDRSALGIPYVGAPPVERKGAVIWAAQVGDLVLLKGENWPNNTGRGAVHRSPPVPAGTKRLVVTFDALAF